MQSDFTSASSKKLLDIQATIECGFTLKRVRHMIRTYSQSAETLTQPGKVHCQCEKERIVRKPIKKVEGKRILCIIFKGNSMLQ